MRITSLFFSFIHYSRVGYTSWSRGLMSIILTNIWVNALVLVMKIELRNIFSLRSTRSMRLNLIGLEGGSGLSLL